MQRKAFPAVVTVVGLLVLPTLSRAQDAVDRAQDAADPEHAMTPSPSAEQGAVHSAEPPPGTAPAAPAVAVASPPAGEPAAAPPPGALPAYPPAPHYPLPAPSDASAAGPQGVMYGPGPIPVGKPAPIGAPGAREHDGLFLRLSVGVGAGFTRYREDVGNVSTRGVAGHFEVAVGGRVLGNLIVHGNLLLSGMDNAIRTVSGVRDASSVIGTNFLMLGGGATYYFMPLNVYVTAALGVAGMNETRDDEKSLESRAGGAGSLTLGKEWWVGRASEWGLGAGLRGMAAWAPVSLAGVESTMLGYLVTVAFTATFN